MFIMGHQLLQFDAPSPPSNSRQRWPGRRQWCPLLWTRRSQGNSLLVFSFLFNICVIIALCVLLFGFVFICFGQREGGKV